MFKNILRTQHTIRNNILRTRPIIRNNILRTQPIIRNINTSRIKPKESNYIYLYIPILVSILYFTSETEEDKIKRIKRIDERINNDILRSYIYYNEHNIDIERVEKLSETIDLNIIVDMLPGHDWMDDYKTLLEIAIKNGNIEFMNYLISKKVEDTDKALYYVFKYNQNIKIAKLLIDNGHIIENKCLDVAIKNQNIEHIEFLVSKGAKSKEYLENKRDEKIKSYLDLQ